LTVLIRGHPLEQMYKYTHSKYPERLNGSIQTQFNYSVAPRNVLRITAAIMKHGENMNNGGCHENIK
jgi:hypothetical protein